MVVFQRRGFAIVGAGLLLVAQTMHRSYENRSVLDRWSYAYVFYLLAWVVLVGVVVLWGAKSSSAYSKLKASARTRMAFVDLGVLMLGCSFVLSALDAPNSAGRLTDGIVFGSTFPPSVVLDGLSLALFMSAAFICAVEWTPSRWRGPLSAAAAVAAVFLLAEAAVRLTALLAPTTQGVPTYKEALWERYFVSENELGFRDEPHLPTVNAGGKRLLVVGDSVAFGWGIKREEDRFGELLSGLLSDATPMTWESLNAASGDTHTLTHIDFMESMRGFEPDVVILLYVFNDIDYLAAVTPRRIAGKYSLFAVAYRNSFLLQEVFARIRVLRHRYRQSPETDPYFDTALMSRHLDDVRQFVEIGRGAGARVWVVPFHIMVGASDAESRKCQDFETAAARKDIPVVRTCEVFLQYPLSDLVVNGLDAHPNEKAHRILAETVHGELLELAEMR